MYDTHTTSSATQPSCSAPLAVSKPQEALYRTLVSTNDLGHLLFTQCVHAIIRTVPLEVTRRGTTSSVNVGVVQWDLTTRYYSAKVVFNVLPGDGRAPTPAARRLLKGAETLLLVADAGNGGAALGAQLALWGAYIDDAVEDGSAEYVCGDGCCVLAPPVLTRQLAQTVRSGSLITSFWR